MLSNQLKSQFLSFLIIYEEIQAFFEDLNYEKDLKISVTKEKSIEDSTINENKKQIFQEKVLKWLSNLNTKEKKEYVKYPINI